MTTTQQALQGARRLAGRAAATRAGVDACPYPADGTERQWACRQVWLREYLRRRPDEAAPVDYGDDLTALADGPDSPDGGEVDESPAGIAAAVAQATLFPGRG
ncbi:hypothetical protein [Micromonospora sp. RP3T]|uniref:hypothetical protein n=1 Tax=Micromonospora sp. RP3T TaxID=2135446 RepID=UPI003D751EBC